MVDREKRGTRSKLAFISCITLILFSSYAIVLEGIPHGGCVLPSSTTSGLGHKESSLASGVGLSEIALVKPIFSATAYSNAFYVFYRLYASSSQAYINISLNLLNVTVKDEWGYSTGLFNFLDSTEARQQGLIFGKNMALIDEIDVTEGGLFLDGRRAYDVVILGFTEYVTSEEYYAYKQFVASGGTLIIMDGCNFLAEVKYYPPTDPHQAGYLSLVKGHGWEFNGTHAWKSVYHRWPEENKNWVGSNYWHYWTGSHYDLLNVNTSHPISAYLRAKFGENIKSAYHAHEENLLQNSTNTQIIGYWHLINSSEYPGEPIVAYQHEYGSGSVIHSGIMASDVVYRDKCIQAFLLGAVKLALTGKVGDEPIPSGGAENPAPLIILSALAATAVIVCVFTAWDRRFRKRLETKR